MDIEALYSELSPEDPDRDGVYTDLTGNGQESIGDVLAYYNNRKSDVIRDNPDFFDYNGDGTVFDAVTLYEIVGGD